jgi:hypothetical protein
MRRGCAALRAMIAKRAWGEPRLAQLLAEPIVQQLMHRDRIDEATTRRLLRTGGRWAGQTLNFPEVGYGASGEREHLARRAT